MISGPPSAPPPVGALLAITLGLAGSAPGRHRPSRTARRPPAPSSLADGGRRRSRGSTADASASCSPAGGRVDHPRAPRRRPPLLAGPRPAAATCSTSPPATPKRGGGGSNRLASSATRGAPHGHRAVLFFPVLASSSETAVPRGSRSNALRPCGLRRQGARHAEEESYRVDLRSRPPAAPIPAPGRARAGAPPRPRGRPLGPGSGTSDGSTGDARHAERPDPGVTAAASTEVDRYATHVGDHSVVVDARRRTLAQRHRRARAFSSPRVARRASGPRARPRPRRSAAARPSPPSARRAGSRAPARRLGRAWRAVASAPPAGPVAPVVRPLVVRRATDRLLHVN